MGRPVCSAPHTVRTPKHRQDSSSTLHRLRCHGVEPGNHVEQLFVATLAKPVELAGADALAVRDGLPRALVQPGTEA